jgi:hypothetical protein
MAKLYNLARMSTATTGTGTITLGSAISGYLTFANAGVADGDFVSYGIKDGANSEAGFGKYTTAGTTLTRNVVKSTNSNTAISLSGAAEVYVTALAADFPFPDNYLSGLTMSNNGGVPNSQIDIVAGVAADALNVEVIRLTSAISKSTASGWAVGTGNGGMDTGTVAASTWYHLWLIRRPDTGVVDALFSTSATSPTMPTSYTQKRRLGSVLTDGASHLIAFSQLGDEFLWSTPVADKSAFNVTSTSQLITLTVPTNVKVRAKFRVLYANSAAAGLALIQSPDESTQAANTPTGNINLDAPSAGVGTAGNFEIRTNTSAQIRAVSAQAGNDLLYVITYGWIDRRGRDG